MNIKLASSVRKMSTQIIPEVRIDPHYPAPGPPAWRPLIYEEYIEKRRWFRLDWNWSHQIKKYDTHRWEGDF